MLNFVESYVLINIFKILLLIHLISIGIGIYYEWGFFAHGIIFIGSIVFYIAIIATFEEEVEGYFFKYLFNSKLSLKHLKELKDLITTYNGEIKFFNTKIKARELEMELKKLKSPTVRYRQLYKILVEIGRKKGISKKILEDRESYEITKKIIGEK
jgi:hypothetical protein